MFGEELAGAGSTYLVAGPADSLQATAHRAGRFDLYHQIDRAHVDPQFERAGGNETFESSPFQFVFDSQPLLAAERPMMGLHQLPLPLTR